MSRPESTSEPPWEFLLSASRNTLQSYELSRLNHAANLRKEIAALLDQWLNENTSAMLARLLLQLRERRPYVPESAPEDTVGKQSSVSDNIFSDRPRSAPPHHVPA